MADQTQNSSDEQQQCWEENHKRLHDLLSNGARPEGESTQSSGLKLTLERMVINHATNSPVPYEGYHGLERVFFELAKTYRGCEVTVDGHLIGVRGSLGIEGHDTPIDLSATLRMGGQLALSVGPSPSLRALSDAIRVFDRQFHLAYAAIGQDFELTAQGYNPAVHSPSDIVPLPLPRNGLISAHLSRTGRYSRDALRCTAMTIISLPLCETPEQSVEDYRLCAALTPVLSFLTDNTLRMRGGDPHDAPHMTRSFVWHQTDPARCGLVPGTFSPSFGFDAYERWVEGIAPIMFVSDTGMTFSTGSDTIARVMKDRVLSTQELEHLLSMVWPEARWNGRLELHAADALPPRLALSYAALFKGLFATDTSRARLKTLLNVDNITDDDVYHAWNNLHSQGWKARVYGRPISQVANELTNIASRLLEDREERRMLDALSQLWEFRMVPRDTLLRTWDRAHPRMDALEAAALYGEGAVTPYEELDGEPPTGSTAVMRALRLKAR